jgi:hypothetical protein
MRFFLNGPPGEFELFVDFFAGSSYEFTCCTGITMQTADAHPTCFKIRLAISKCARFSANDKKVKPCFYSKKLAAAVFVEPESREIP